MTNTNDWTYCTLYLSPIDDEDAECHTQIAQLLGELEDPDDKSPLSFFAHTPIPQILIDNCYKIGEEVENENFKQTGYRFLHEFTKKEWGTSFDACDVTYSEATNGDSCFEFRTLEGVCLPWLEKLSSEFPGVYFDMDCQNELDLFDSYTVSYSDGVQIDFEAHKKSNKKKTK
jgi:hypothetical protein